MSKSDAPAAPDLTPIADAMKLSTEMSAKTSAEQLAWAREQYNKDRGFTKKVHKLALNTAREQKNRATEQYDRWKTEYKPLEDSLISEANSYNTEARQEQAAGSAQADVSMQYEQARNAAQDQLEQYGIDPTQVRSQALDIGSRMAEAGARAAAGNQARDQAEAKGWALRDSAINIGKGLPATSMGFSSGSVTAGNADVNANLATTATGAQTQGTGVQWAALGNQSAANWGSMLNQKYATEVSAYKAEQESSSGIGSILGTIAGVAGKAYMASDERMKENIEQVGETNDGQPIYRYNYKGSDQTQIGLIAQEVEGHRPEAIATDEHGFKHVDYKTATDGAVGKVPHHREGGIIDDSQSPSRGQAIDDVPGRTEDGSELRMNAGEYIVPVDVVRWKGEEFFQKTIDQARTARGEGSAKPRMKQAIPA